MKVVEYRGSKTFEVAERTPTAPAAGEVQVKVAYVGLCGTDLHVYLGDMDARVPAGSVIGHEMSGTVAAVGEGVTTLSVGDPVTVMPTRFCGECRACRKGHSNVCYQMDFIGLDSPGALQEYWNVPADLVVALDAGADLRDAALIEPLTVAVHDVRRANLTDDESVLVVGGGPIGLLIALVAGTTGATVVLSEPEAGRRAMAEELGITAVDPTSGGLQQAIAETPDGVGFDVAFEVSGSAPGIESAFASLAARGRLVEVAIHAAPRPINLHGVFWRELEMYGARLYHLEDMQAAAELVGQGRVPVAKLISKVTDLSQVGVGFGELSRGEAMKVLIKIDPAA